ncbi:putative bifunctional cbb3-type cytochrome c oxidase subunit II/cytochrome c [Thalassovita autumnalis]|jgi:mono/diheme cytochrome c family protein|uniref:Bifunctional cbb3-type cytochrome c oxidase subunit II/cytochrome c n=1 Tax=Thalassovita autumnalis TaxID=2072972 RepID=A0A0N7LXE7_9RHOB|nr:cytochrome c [Thalassovita autumnalis]CUH65111.1 putative bifunctional cbb3-type cytochrome c oxidase subunit II/cytochrome c [Thalassovita autumnalis]CUH71695.1 putative bifunctional cbb3-type cytochrome c oxidase subunit II/cytochrome c [Thalassovita autumnalis]
MNKTGLFVGGVLLAGLVVAALQFLQPAPATLGHSMVTPDTSRIAQGEPIVELRIPANLSAEAEIGKRAFEAKCADCHGENAAGQNGVAPPLVHKIYEPSHHSDMAFVLAAKNGVRAHHWKFGNMPPVKGLTQADVKYIARYVRELQRENGIN